MIPVLIPVFNSQNFVACLKDNDFVFTNLFSAEDQEYAVFDAAKTMAFLGWPKDRKFYDIDILYRLHGLKFESLQELVKLVFNESKAQTYVELCDLVSAYRKSYINAKIDSRNFYVNKIMPVDVLKEYYRQRAFLIRDLYLKVRDQEDVVRCYESLYSSIVSLFKIASVPLHVDEQCAKLNENVRVKSILPLIKNNKTTLKFNVVGAKTGRLGFKKNSVNMYGLPKTLRHLVVPKKDCKIFEFDFKNFQPRIAIFSTANQQFKDKFKNVDDIYSQFPGDREENKIDLIAWMYSKNKNAKFDKEALPIKQLREYLYGQSKINGKVENLFDRPLHFEQEEDHVVFQNFITSIEADIMLRLVDSLYNEIFNGTSSRILFPFHDAIVCEIHKNDEANLVSKIQDFMQQFVHNIFDAKFPVSGKSGNNFGDMKDILLPQKDLLL